MVINKAIQPYGLPTSFQDSAPTFSHTSPRPDLEAGTSAHADGGAVHAIKVQCQALACGATLQVRVPLEYFSANGPSDVLVHCGECNKLLRVQLPQRPLSGPTSTVVPPLVPTPTPAGPPAASTASPALQDAATAAAAAAAAASQVPASSPALQDLAASAVSSGATVFNNNLPTSCSRELQQHEQCEPGAGSISSKAGDESVAASWQRQQAQLAQLAQLNKLAAGTRNTAPAMLVNSGPPIPIHHARQQHGSAASQTSSSQLTQQQPKNPQVSRAPMGPPAARVPSIRPLAPGGLPAGDSPMHVHPSSHAAGNSASLGTCLGQQQTALGSGAAAAAGPQQGIPAGWSDPAVEIARRHQLQPGPRAVGGNRSEHPPASVTPLPPHPAGNCSSGGGQGDVELHPVAAIIHSVPGAVRCAEMKQLTYQEVLEQATRATLNAPRSPVRNPYRALVEDQLQHNHWQQQYWQQRLQLQQFERNRAAMPAGPDLNRPGSGYGPDHTQYSDQYLHNVLNDAGIKRRMGPGTAALTQHGLDILEQQQGKRFRRLEEPVHSATAATVAVHQRGLKEAVWSGDNPGNWNSSKAAALTDIAAAAQRYDLPPAAAAAAELCLTPSAAQQYGISRPGTAGHTSHGVSSMQRIEFASGGTTATRGEGEILPGHGVMPPPRPIMGAAVGLHKLGSDAVNNALVTGTSTPTPTAAAALASLVPGAAASAALGPSPYNSTGMGTVNSSRPQSFEESWQAIASTQQVQQLYSGSEPAATPLESARHELSACGNEEAEKAQGGTLKPATLESGGNFYTSLLQEAMTPEDRHPGVPDSAATVNPSAVARASPPPPAEQPAAAASHQTRIIEAGSPAGTPPPAATPAGAAPAASNRPTAHASHSVAELSPRAASVTTTSAGELQHLASPASLATRPSAAAAAQVFHPSTQGISLPAAAVNPEGLDGRSRPPFLGPVEASSMYAAADSPPVGGAVSREGRQAGAARPPVIRSCDTSAQSSGDTRSTPQQQQPHVHQQQGVASAAGIGEADSHTADAQGSPVAGGDCAASHIQLPSIAPAGATTVTWGSSIDTTAEPSELGLAHLNTTSSSPGFDTRSSTHPPPESPVALLRHNSAPVTTGVALMPRKNGTAGAAMVVTPGPLATGAAAGAARQA